MKFDWDFSELTDFADNLKSLGSAFDPHLQRAVKEIARLLQEALFRNTPVLTGNLAASWGGEENYSFTVKPLKSGYSVTLKNHAMNNKSSAYRNFKYGLAVNDGHKTPNGGWVMGRFFVEKSIIQTSESNELEAIIMRELQDWWKGV